jgi:hypothetical protein
VWYLSTFVITWVLVLVADRLGMALLSLTPRRFRSYAKASYAPACGLGVLILLAAFLGWVGEGFGKPLALAVALVIFVLCVTGRPIPYPAPRRVALLVVFSLGCSFPWLYAIARYESFNAYNDAFTYLSQAQWLQTHSFREEVHPSGYHPALTQISVAQISRWPVGAPFLLAWVQAVFGASWSYLVYPAVTCFALVCLGLAIAGTLRLISRASWRFCLLGGMGAVTGLNGISFGSTHGFLLQTVGLAPAVGGLSLTGLYLASKVSWKYSGWRHAAPPAVLLAATALTYHAILPFVAAALLLSFSLFLIRDSARRPELSAFLMRLLCLTCAFANLEIVRLARSLPVWATAGAGTPVTWSPDRFLAHAAGFISGPWDLPVMLFGKAAPTYAVLGLMLTLGFAGLLCISHRERIRVLVPALAFVLVAAGGFMYYRYGRASPWGIGVGDTYRQFKLCSWSSPFVILLMAGGCLSLARARRWARAWIAVLIPVWVGGGVMWDCALSRTRTAVLREETRCSAPFRYYESVRDNVLARAAREDGIYLGGLGGAHHKHRQMLLYFLMDYRLLSDWSEDGYLAGQLPAAERVLPLASARWLLSPPADGAICEEECVAPNLQLKLLGSQVRLVSVAGGYPQESDASGWWRWTADRLVFHYRVKGELPVWIRVRFMYLPAVRRRVVNLTLEDREPLLQTKLVMEPGWGSFSSAPMRLDAREFRIVFSSDDAAERISREDPRLLNFLVKNLSVDVVREPDGTVHR